MKNVYFLFSLMFLTVSFSMAQPGPSFTNRGTSGTFFDNADDAQGLRAWGSVRGYVPTLSNVQGKLLYTNLSQLFNFPGTNVIGSDDQFAVGYAGNLLNMDALKSSVFFVSESLTTTGTINSSNILTYNPLTGAESNATSDNANVFQAWKKHFLTNHVLALNDNMKAGGALYLLMAGGSNTRTASTQSVSVVSVLSSNTASAGYTPGPSFHSSAPGTNESGDYTWEKGYGEQTVWGGIEFGGGYDITATGNAHVGRMNRYQATRKDSYSSNSVVGPATTDASITLDNDTSRVGFGFGGAFNVLKKGEKGMTEVNVGLDIFTGDVKQAQSTINRTITLSEIQNLQTHVTNRTEDVTAIGSGDWLNQIYGIFLKHTFNIEDRAWLALGFSFDLLNYSEEYNTQTTTVNTDMYNNGNGVGENVDITTVTTSEGPSTKASFKTTFSVLSLPVGFKMGFLQDKKLEIKLGARHTILQGNSVTTSQNVDNNTYTTTDVDRGDIAGNETDFDTPRTASGSNTSTSSSADVPLKSGITTYHHAVTYRATEKVQFDIIFDSGTILDLTNVQLSITINLD